MLTQRSFTFLLASVSLSGVFSLPASRTHSAKGHATSTVASTSASSLSISTSSTSIATSSGSISTSVSTSTSSTPTSTSTSTSTSNGTSGDVVMAAWYPGWDAATTPPDQLSWSKYTAMIFSFAVPTSDPSVISLDSTSEAALPTFVSQAKKNNVKAILSLGGWSGSQYFSPAVASETSRTAFIKAILALVSKYDLDGIDFDWEYPGKQGSSDNQVSPDDSSNFLTFLQALRQDPAGANLVLSAPVGVTPFAGTDGTPMSDVSAFGAVLDYIEIMAYDIWGTWSSDVGPNAPLYDACAASKAGSAASAVQSWTDAKFPANQIVLGVASYGRSYTVSSSNAAKIGDFPAFDASLIPAGNEDASTTASSSNSGLFNFNGLIKEGYLSQDGSAAVGVTYKWDDCSQTPFIYKASSQIMVSYDDAHSFASKGNWIAAQNLKGFAMWHAIGDSNDILVDSIRSAVKS